MFFSLILLLHTAFLMGSQHLHLCFAEKDSYTYLEVQTQPSMIDSWSSQSPNSSTIIIQATSPIYISNTPQHIRVFHDKTGPVYKTTLQSTRPFLMKKIQQSRLKTTFLLHKTGNTPNSFKQPPQPVIIIDPAHGGSDLGETANNLCEKNFTLELGLTLAETLQRRTDYKVHITRTRDIHLSGKQRAHITNSLYPTCYITLHMVTNKDPNIRGAMVYYPETIPGQSPPLASWAKNQKETIQKASVSLASCILKHLKEGVFLYKEHLRTLTPKEEPLPCAHVYVCLGHISNEHEANIMKQPTYQKSLANLITHGVIEFIQQLTHPTRSSDLGNACGNEKADLQSQWYGTHLSTLDA